MKTNTQKYPCWAVSIEKETEIIQSTRLVQNQEQAEEAQKHYRQMFGNNNICLFLQKEPFLGW